MKTHAFRAGSGLFVALFASACSCSFQSPGRETLEQAYPPKALRAEIAEQRGEPFRTFLVEENFDDGFLQHVAGLIERDFGTTPLSCDVHWVFRGGLGASFGAVGIYWDYVFYDHEGAVIQARRRFVD
jgi:hypothetical protein